MDCLLLQHQSATPPNFAEKTFANSHKTVTFAKFSPSKVSRYQYVFVHFLRLCTISVSHAYSLLKQLGNNTWHTA